MCVFTPHSVYSQQRPPIGYSPVWLEMGIIVTATDERWLEYKLSLEERREWEMIAITERERITILSRTDWCPAERKASLQQPNHMNTQSQWNHRAVLTIWKSLLTNKLVEMMVSKRLHEIIECSSSFTLRALDLKDSGRFPWKNIRSFQACDVHFGCDSQLAVVGYTQVHYGEDYSHSHIDCNLCPPGYHLFSSECFFSVLKSLPSPMIIQHTTFLMFTFSEVTFSFLCFFIFIQVIVLTTTITTKHV